MLYYLFEYLEQQFQFPGASLFGFITFRAAVAIILSLLISTIFGKRIIRFLQAKQVGETIRDLGLEGQVEKAGTPTMGGIIIILATLILTVNCAKQMADNSQVGKNEITKATENGCTRPSITEDSGKYHRAQFGSAFSSWLSSNGYSTYNKTFYSSTSPQSYTNSFSGWGGADQSPSSCVVSKDPVIFIHGNGDSAQDWAFDGPMAATGAPRADFVSAGYNANEIFALSVNNPSALSATNNYHKSDQLEKIKNFIIAVKAYTGASKVDIIGHSLGVTMARRAIQDNGLGYMVDTFVGIAGANHGMYSCGTYPYAMVATKTCGAYFYWGWPIYVDGLAMNSPHLSSLGEDVPGASKVYTIYSWNNDELLMGYTSTAKLNNADKNCDVRWTSGHFGLMHSTGNKQLAMVRDHNPYGGGTCN